MIAWRTGIDTRRNGFRVVLILLLLLALGLGMGVSQALAAPPDQSAEDGQALFQGKCTACHTIGQGDMLGPDLKGVTTRRDADWLARFMAAPDQVMASGDPIAAELLSKYKIAMPNLGLTETEVAALIAFLGIQAEGAPEPQPTLAPKAAVSEGDAIAGKELFTGAARFQNGGPACVACHTTADIGLLGGGALGPNLTGAYTKLGHAMVVWPETVPPMKAIYQDKPLTQGEKDNLLALFQSASAAQRQPGAMGQLALLAVAGSALLLGFAHLFWWRRLRGVRRAMVARRTSPSRNVLGG